VKLYEFSNLFKNSALKGKEVKFQLTLTIIKNSISFHFSTLNYGMLQRHSGEIQS